MIENIKKVKDNFQAFLVEKANFVGNEGYPQIEWWMVPKEPPKIIIPFNKLKEFKGIIDDSYICFYCRDEDFLKVKRNPKKYLTMFKRCKGLIGFDFSIHNDMPLVVQKKQIYDNLALSYFFGKNNIPLIPNIRYGLEETEKDFINAIPKNCLVAIGTYGFIKTIAEQIVWFDSIIKILERIEPSGVIVYGSLPKDLENWFYWYSVPLFKYESYTSQKMREVKKHGN